MAKTKVQRKIEAREERLKDQILDLTEKRTRVAMTEIEKHNDLLKEAIQNVAGEVKKVALEDIETLNKRLKELRYEKEFLSASLQNAKKVVRESGELMEKNHEEMKQVHQLIEQFREGLELKVIKHYLFAGALGGAISILILLLFQMFVL